MSEVRSTLTLTYDDQARELKVTFDLIDRVSDKIDWEVMYENLRKGIINYSKMAKFMYINLREAGFSAEDVSIDEIYDEMNASQENGQSYIELVIIICNSYLPRGKKKQQVTEAKKAKTKKLKTA